MGHTAETAELRADYAALSSSAGFVITPNRTVLELTGKDHATLLHNLCTNDIKRLRPGQGCEAFITSVQGKVLGHVIVFREGESIRIDTVPGQSLALRNHFERYIITEDVTVHDLSDQRTDLFLCGPGSSRVLAELNCPTPALEYEHIRCSIADHSVVNCRVDMTASDDFLISCDASAVNEIQLALTAEGARFCDCEAFEIARVEYGFPMYGQDMTDKNLPQEIDRDTKAISFTKGCYLGQETVARIDALGHVNRKLVSISFPQSSRVPGIGSVLRAGDVEVGSVTSAVLSIRRDFPVAIGYVRTHFANIGQQLESTVGQGIVANRDGSI